MSALEKRGVVLVVCHLCFLIIVGKLCGFEDVPTCYRNLETHFFRSDAVRQSLSMHNVPQNQWSSLLNQLQEKSKRVPGLINAQAKQLTPNPLEQPFQPEIAVTILKRALFLVFQEVMQENYVTLSTNSESIQQMFEHIWIAQHSMMVQCLGDAAFENEKIKE